jgi:AbrB family looped-hinge helix DNA binding protein
MATFAIMSFRGGIDFLLDWSYFLCYSKLCLTEEPMSELTTIRVSSKGQIVIPQPVREQMGLEPGDTLVLARYGNALILKKLTLDSLLEESERNFLEGRTLSHEEAFKGLT